MCTAVSFVDEHDNLYFGRNLDWSCGYGERIVITPTGYKPHSPFGAIEKIKYPIIGMGIVEEDTPLYFDCANSEGLAVAGLNFPGYGFYEDANEYWGGTKVAAYEFPLWVTANHATVEEVIDDLLRVLIVDKPINDEYPSSILHWMISDSKRTIVVEQVKGDAIDISNLQWFYNDFNVLANQPGFEWHAENVKNYINLSSEVPSPKWTDVEPYGSGAGMRGLPGDYYSPSRFARAAYLNLNYPSQEGETNNINRLFHTLGGVAMIDGAAKMLNGEYEKTIYTSGYSSKTNTYYYNTYEDYTIKSAALTNVGTELIQIQNI